MTTPHDTQTVAGADAKTDAQPETDTTDNDAAEDTAAEANTTTWSETSRGRIEADHDSRATTRREQRHVGPTATTTCPECNGDVVHEDGAIGEAVCSDCGLVLAGHGIDRGPEWRAYDAREREERSRVGDSLSTCLHDRGLSTVIGPGDDSARIKRLRKWQERITWNGGRGKHVRHAFSEIRRLTSAMALPRAIREEAAHLYRRADDEDLPRRRDINSVASACVYAAARSCDAPRHFATVEQYSRVDRTDIERAYSALVRELGMNIQLVDSVEFVPRIRTQLDLGIEVERTARKMLNIAEGEPCYVGRDPAGLAAGAVYAASLIVGVEVTQDEVGEAANVTATTIRTHYRNLINIGTETTPEEVNPRVNAT